MNISTFFVHKSVSLFKHSDPIFLPLTGCVKFDIKKWQKCQNLGGKVSHEIDTPTPLPRGGVKSVVPPQNRKSSNEGRDWQGQGGSRGSPEGSPPGGWSRVSARVSFIEDRVMAIVEGYVFLAKSENFKQFNNLECVDAKLWCKNIFTKIYFRKKYFLMWNKKIIFWSEIKKIFLFL